MRKLIIFFLIFVLIGLSAACSPEEAEVLPTPTPIPTASPTPSPSPTPTPTPVPTPTPTPYVQKSLTTGLPYDGEYKPVLVSIENSPAARPQRGLQTADVVYEIPVEGSVTRFLCLFSDNVPEEVMPVRSARVPFLYVIKEWDCIFMHWGGSGSEHKSGTEPYNFFGHKLYDDISFDVDGHTGHWNDYFYRVDYAKAPHNVMGNPALAQQLYDYEPKPISWLFDEQSTYEGEAVEEIKLPMCTNISDYVSYTYDKENDVYLRSMQGKKFLSAETDEQLSVKNIIVQYSSYKVTYKIKLWKMTGEGKADFYIGGVKIEGTWKRDSADDQTLYLDSEGNQIVLRPGNTWIHLHPND